MKAFGIKSFGDTSVFTEIEKNIPQKLDGKFLLEVEAFGVNPYDVNFRLGKITSDAEFPFILGNDVVGRVVNDFATDEIQQNDLVINYRGKMGYSEYVTAAPKSVIPLPLFLTPAQGATLPTPTIAAYNLFNQYLKDNADKRILIIGITGMVGRLLSFILNKNNIEHFGLSSGKNEKIITALNLDQAHHYTYDAINPHNKFDIIINTSFGGNNVEFAKSLVTPGGKIVELNDTKNGFEVLNSDYSLPLSQTLGWISKYPDLVNLLDEIDQNPFTLDGVIAAQAKLEERYHNKQVVVKS